MNDLVSVIIPVYNGEKYIRRCVDSLLNQTYENIEIVIIDDGSEDDTSNILDEFFDSRIRVIKQKNSGVSIARNTGIDASNGMYIVFCDDDDFYEPDFIEFAHDQVVKNPFSWLVFSNNNLREQNVALEPSILEDKEFYSISDGYSNTHLHGVSAYCWGKIYESKIIKDNKIYFDSEYKIGEDVIFNLEYISYMDRVITFSKIGYNYFRNTGVTSVLENTFDLDRELYNLRMKYISDSYLNKYRNITFNQFEKSIRAIWSKNDLSVNEKIELSNSIIRSREFKECLDVCLHTTTRERRLVFYKSKNYLVVYLVDLARDIKIKIKYIYELFVTDISHRIRRGG